MQLTIPILLILLCPKPIPLPFKLMQTDSVYYIEKVNSPLWGHNEYFTGQSFTPDARFTMKLKDTCVLKALFFKGYAAEVSKRAAKYDHQKLSNPTK